LKRIFLLVAVAATAAVALPSAQSSFRTSVQYVAVDVVVTDRDDKPIGDLAIGDFEILENGKPQKVADFQFISIPAINRNIPANAPRAAEPDVVSNSAPTRNSRLFVILVDDLHLIEHDLIRLKRTLTDLVNMFAPEDEVALTFVSHSNLSVNFTRNKSRLMERVDNIKAVLGFGLDSLARMDGADPGGTGPVSKVARWKADYALSTYRTLANVTKALRGSDHTRRAIFFVSGGTTLDMSLARSEDPGQVVAESMSLALQDGLTGMFSSARGGSVPIYAIDPRGNVQPEDVVRWGMGGSITTLANPALRAEALKNIRIQHNNLAMLAVNTGGRAIFNASDMTRMMTEIVQENGSYYLLGYYPEPFAADGKYHEIKVRVKRDGVIVRARQGYEAPSASRSAVSVTDTLNAATASSVNVSALPLRVFAEPIASDGKTATVAVTVEVTYPAPADGSKRFDDSLSLKLLALDPDAKTKASATKTHRFTGAVPPSGAVSFLINDVIQVPLQPVTLRVAVGSELLGKAGMIQLPIEMTRESKGLSLGGIVVGFDGAPRQAAMAPRAFDGLIPFQPTTTRVFAQSDVLRLFGHVYWKDKNAQPAMTMTLTGPNGAVNSTPSLIGQNPAGDQQDAVMAAVLPLQGLAAGSYHLAISATLPGAKPVSRDVLFEIK
jgi:VWFA-related protein